jgi:peptidoglycan LD-endopeptidase LytH
LKSLISLILINLIISTLAFADSLAVFDKWDLLDKKIALNKTDKYFAIQLIKKYEIESAKYYYFNHGRDVKRDEWIFPLKNFSSFEFYKNGKDYNEDSYDYFEGNKSWNHPANDIFIADTNKDCMDDITGKPVDVVSMSGGIVVAADTTWEQGSILRAGKYIRIYDVTNKRLFYYSHLNTIFKKPGDIVYPGDKIGEVGRTGRMAILPDGTTHLHIALLYLDNGYPMPETLISDFKRMGKIK